MSESQPALASSNQSVQETDLGTTRLSQSTDQVIEHPDGTLELAGYIFCVDWDEIDPPEGYPDAEEIPHEAVMTEVCELMGLPPGSL